MDLDVSPPQASLDLAPERSLDTPSLSRPESSPTDLALPPDRPDLQIYASALNGGFATGLDDRGLPNSPVLTNERLVNLARAEGPEVAVAALPELGVVQNEAMVSTLQTTLAAGLPAGESVLEGSLDPSLATPTSVDLARGMDLDDAIMVTFPDQEIASGDNTISGLGHAGVLLIDDESGLTKYYEYGRYDGPDGSGIVIKRDIPDAVIDSNTGRPTRESMAEIFEAISYPINGGASRDIRAAYYDDKISFDAANGYAQDRMALNDDLGRDPYNAVLRNCAHFMRDVVVEGGADFVPYITVPSPNAFMADVRFFNAASQKPVDYNADTRDIETPWARPW